MNREANVVEKLVVHSVIELRHQHIFRLVKRNFNKENKTQMGFNTQQKNTVVIQRVVILF